MISRKLEKLLLAIAFCVATVLMAAPLSASASTSVWVPNASYEYASPKEVRYDVKAREVTMTLVTDGFKDEYFMVDTWNTNASWCVYFTDGKNNYRLECHSPYETGFYTMTDMKGLIGRQVGTDWYVYDCSFSVNGNELTWVATLPESKFQDPINVNAVEVTGYYYYDDILERSSINTIFQWSLDNNGNATLRKEKGDIPFFMITEYRDEVKSIDVDVDWFPAYEYLFLDFENLEYAKIKAGRTYGDSLAGMFSGCHKLRKVDLGGLNTKGVEDMNRMFSKCTALTDLDVSGLDTYSVKSMESMFDGCESLGSVNLSNFRTSNLENMNYMFFRCASLTSLDVSTFDTSKVTNMRLAFACGIMDYNEETYEETLYSKLKTIKLGKLNTSNVVDASNMFQGCIALTELDVSSFNTSKMQDMGNMFRDCRSLKSLDVTKFNTSSATDMVSMFYGCSSLKELNLSSFDTSNVTNVNFMFCNCNSLKSLDLSNFDLGKVTSAMGFLSLEYDNALQTIKTPKNLTLDCELPYNEGFWQNQGTAEYGRYLPKNETSSKTLVFDHKTKVADLFIAKKSLTLYDTITIDFKVNKSVKDQYHGLYLLAMQGEDVTKLTDYTEDGDLLVFHYRVAPQTMNEAVEAIPCAANADGENVMGTSLAYSVADYCYNMLGKEEYQAGKYANFRRLLVDILRYGDAAQIYDGYKTDELAGSNLTAEQLAMGTNLNAEMTYLNVKNPEYDTVSNPSAEITNAALYLEAAVNVQFKFTANSLSGLTVVVSDGTNVLGRLTPNAANVDTQGRYYVTYKGLNAGEMRKVIYVAVMKGGKKVSNTYRYSIESYVASMHGNHSAELDDLLDAMMRYGDSAAAFAGTTK